MIGGPPCHCFPGKCYCCVVCVVSGVVQRTVTFQSGSVTNRDSLPTIVERVHCQWDGRNVVEPVGTVSGACGGSMRGWDTSSTAFAGVSQFRGMRECAGSACLALMKVMREKV